MTFEKVVLVLGGSGIIGSGVIKALLKNEKTPRIVTMARSVEKLAAMKKKFGNVSEEKLLIVEGNLTSEDNATKLRDDILAKTGIITDVISSMGAWWQKGPLLNESLSEYNEVCDNLLTCHFVAAKIFLPLIGDNDKSSYTFITGPEDCYYLPNTALFRMFKFALVRMSCYLMQEWEQKPVRINVAQLLGLVKDPENVVEIIGIEDVNLPPAVDHEVAGRGIAGIVLIPSARGQKLAIKNEVDFVKLAATGTL